MEHFHSCSLEAREIERAIEAYREGRSMFYVPDSLLGTNWKQFLDDPKHNSCPDVLRSVKAENVWRKELMNERRNSESSNAPQPISTESSIIGKSTRSLAIGTAIGIGACLTVPLFLPVALSAGLPTIGVGMVGLSLVGMGASLKGKMTQIKEKTSVQ